jgi:dTDP-4-dehydrorhamnose reductase
MSITVLIAGATGLLGSRLSGYLSSRGYEIFTLSRSGDSNLKADASDRNNLYKVLGDRQFDIVINLIALTNVEECEVNPNEAYLANTHTVENLVSWIADFSPRAHFIQISTDQVYDGSGPHVEEAVTLLNTYAYSKYAGELAAKLIPSSIIRTNFVGRSDVVGGKSLSDWMYGSLTQGLKIEVLQDVYFSPVSITTLSRFIGEIIAKRPIGVFNLGSKNGMSKASFLFELAYKLGLDSNLMTPVAAEDARFFNARRPQDMRMDSSMLETELGLQLPELSQEIGIVANEY